MTTRKDTASSAALQWARRARQLAVCALMMGAGLGGSVPAQAQLFGDNEARKAILDLRSKVNELERQLTDRAADLDTRLTRVEPTQRSQLELANQIEQLKAELAQLRGQVDQLSNELAAQHKRTRELYADLDARLKKLEPISVALDGQSVTVDRHEQASFEAALALFRAGDFRAAASDLKTFLARYPASPYAAQAQYWLGNAHYQLKDYKAASAAQRSLLERHPDSPRAPDALLNLAASQIELADRNGARNTLNRILKEHPDSEAASAARERLKSLGK